MLDKYHEHLPNYMADIEMAINFTFNASIKNAPFEILYGENILLPIDLILSRESWINPHAHTFARKMKQLVTKLKSTMHDI